mgnify:CR=1 FL=1
MNTTKTKKGLSVLLAIIMVFSMISTAFSVTGVESCPVMNNNTYIQKYGMTLGQYGANEIAEPENMGFDDMLNKVGDLLENIFVQCQIYSAEHDYHITHFKNYKLRTQPATKKIEVASHNRKKQYLLEEGKVIPPLVDMGIFTRDGKVIASMYHKYKQINRFLEIIDDELSDSEKELHVIDFGCGKSYLTFILYYYLTEVKHIPVQMIGLDLKADVIAKCNAAAEAYGYTGLRFEMGDINSYKAPFDGDMVITLHACDTATDFALYNAIQWNTKMIFSVPCCQHELNAQIKTDELSVLTKYGIIKERVAALLTDGIRGSLLEACGYKTQLLEFVDLTHSPKNILIRAVRSNVPKKKRLASLAEVHRAMKEFSVEPTLYKLLNEAGRLPEE